MISGPVLGWLRRLRGRRANRLRSKDHTPGTVGWRHCCGRRRWGIVLVMVLRMSPNGVDGKRYIPIVVAFVPWMAVPSAVILLVALAIRRRALAMVSVLCLAVQLVWHVGFLYPRASLSASARSAVAQSSVVTDDRYARIMTLNTRNGLADAAAIVRTVREQHVEVLALQELNPALISRLNEAGLRELLPYAVGGGRLPIRQWRGERSVERPPR